MRIYVAGKWEDRLYCRKVMGQLITAGHIITCDWAGHDYPDNNVDSWLMYYAMIDVVGVQESDMLVCICTKPYEYRGLYVELGVALACGHPVAIIGHGIDRCIFTSHPLVKRYGGLSRLIKDISK
jgi:hypothetical protein